MAKSAMVKRLWKRTPAWFVALVCAVPAVGCGPARPRETRQVVPQLELGGVRFRIYRGATLRARGEAVAVTYRRDTTDVAVRDVRAMLFGGATPVEIAAPEGHGVVSDRTFEATGGVVARRDADVARTPSARFEPREGGEGLVRGDEAVTVAGKGYRLEGTGFTLAPSTGEIVLGGHPRLLAGLGEAQ